MTRFVAGVSGWSDVLMRLMTWGRRHPDAVNATGLALLPVVVMGRALLPGRVLSPADNLLAFFPWKIVAPDATPHNPLVTDVTTMFHPWLIYASSELASGRVPLWNPHAFAGAPFFANPQTALLFPLTWLGLVLPGPLAISLGAIFRISLAAVSMYWLLRVLSVARGAAVIGALAYMFNAVLMVWLHWSASSALAVLPLIFGALERVRLRGGARPVVLLGVVVALQIFAGYPQVAEMGLAAAALWALYRARDGGAPVTFLLRSAGGMALGLALSAVQVLPFLEYLRESAVLAYRTDWMRLYSLPFRAAITLLMPYYYGSPITGDYWGAANFNELTTSAGPLPWVVLPVALTAAWSRVGTKFFAGLAVFALIMIYRVPLVAPLLASIPPFSLMINTRLAFMLVFALCVLLGLGLDTIARGAVPVARAAWSARATFAVLTAAPFLLLLEHSTLMAGGGSTRIPPGAQFALLVVLLSVATLTVLYLIERPRWRLRWWMGLAIIQLAGTLPLAATYNGVIDVRHFYPWPPALRHLEAAAGGSDGRVLVTGTTVQPANITALARLSDAGGYDGMTPRRIEQLIDPQGSVSWSASDPINVTLRPSSPAFDLVGIRRVLAPPESPSPADHFTLEYDDADGRVFRNDRALPRAFVVFRARACIDDATSLELVHAGRVEFRDEAILAECEATPLAGPGGRQRAATIRRYEPDRVVVDTVTDAPGYLVLTDTWFPGWRATVDGAKQPIRRANHALRAVWVPPGHHTVEFRYAPASVRIGLGISLAALALMLIITWGAPTWPARSVGGLEGPQTSTRSEAPPGTRGVPRKPGRFSIIRGGPWLLAVAVVLAGLLAGSWGGVRTALPPAPFALSARPSTMREGGELTLELRARADAPGADTRVDLYVAVIQDGKFSGAFLTPDGIWAPNPEPYRQRTALADMHGLTLHFRRVNPAGWFTFRLYFLRPSAEKLNRKHYVRQPLDVTVRVEAATPGTPRDQLALAGLAVFTLSAWTVVFRYPRRRPPIANPTST